MPTAWAYLVVSSEAQAETLAHQEAWASEVARSNDWTITSTFRGVSSGRLGTRGLLETLLERLRATDRTQRPERVLMIRLDRLGRGLGLEALAALSEIVQLGVMIHTRQDGDYTLSRASDSLLPLMRIVTGAIENEARRDKARAVYARRRAGGVVVSNKRPYGLRVENGHDVADEPRAEAVRLAFELSANGFGLAAIGRRLRATAAERTWVNGHVSRAEWENTRVARLLANRLYRGIVVAPEIWDRVQLLRGSGTTSRVRGKHPWPLSGALSCECGRTLIGSIVGSPPRRVYRCNAKLTHGRHITHGAKLLESRFAEVLSQLVGSPDLLKQYASQSPSVMSAVELAKREAALNERSAVATTERDRAWKLNAGGLIGDRELSRRLRELDGELKAVAAEREQVEVERLREAERNHNAQTAAQLLTQAASLWSGADVEQQRAAAQALARALNGFRVLLNGAIRPGEGLARNLTGRVRLPDSV